MLRILLYSFEKLVVRLRILATIRLPRGRNATCAIASTKVANLSEAGTTFAGKRRLFGFHKC
jgi:hypothetical protein